MIAILVEGSGDKRALPHLLQGRLSQSVRYIDMKGKSNIIREHRGFEDTVRRQHALGYRSFIVLVDGDVTSAPYRTLDEERQQMAHRAQSVAQEVHAIVYVCWAVREMESWLIGGLRTGATYCGLRQVARIPVNTEASPTDPKRWLQQHLKSPYDARTQECIAQHTDWATASQHNRSLQQFLEAIQNITS